MTEDGLATLRLVETALAATHAGHVLVRLVTATAVGDNTAMTTVQGDGTVAGRGDVLARAGAAVAGPQTLYADVDVGTGSGDRSHDVAAAAAAAAKEPKDLNLRHSGALAEPVVAAEPVVPPPPSSQLSAQLVIPGAAAAVQVTPADTTMTSPVAMATPRLRTTLVVTCTASGPIQAAAAAAVHFTEVMSGIGRVAEHDVVQVALLGTGGADGVVDRRGQRPPDEAVTHVAIGEPKAIRQHSAPAHTAINSRG